MVRIYPYEDTHTDTVACIIVYYKYNHCVEDSVDGIMMTCIQPIHNVVLFSIAIVIPIANIFVYT